jgi:predicted TIM-barrel fold metal-dependent hydrolase
MSDASLQDRYVAGLQDHQCDELVAAMDVAGVHRAVLLLPDFTYVLRDCELSIEEMFERHAAILDRHPGRFEVLAGVDPRWGKDAVALFERGVEQLGFRGLKIYPPCGYRPDDPALFPMYEICAQRGLPVVVHMGPTSPVLGFSTARPELVDGAAQAFPSVPFILAHGATAHASDCADLCTYRPNVYLDVSGFQSVQAVDPDFTALRLLFRRGIHHKILYGTDWPVFRLQGTPATEAATFLSIAEAELGPGQLDLIMCRNAERLWPAARRAARASSAAPPMSIANEESRS